MYGSIVTIIYISTNIWHYKVKYYKKYDIKDTTLDIQEYEYELMRESSTYFIGLGNIIILNGIAWYQPLIWFGLMMQLSTTFEPICKYNFAIVGIGMLVGFTIYKNID